MRVKEITVGGSYTTQPVAYHSVKGEFQVTVEVDEKDDIEEVQEKIGVFFQEGLVGALNRAMDVHNGVSMGTLQLGSIDDDVDNEDDDWG